MNLPPFLLNDWLDRHKDITFNLAGSTGPQWTLDQLVELSGDCSPLRHIALSYLPPSGGTELRAEIAAYHGVSPDWVIVSNGASEAFVMLFVAVARMSGTVLLPFPAYPALAGMARATHLGTNFYRLQRGHSFKIDPDQIADRVDRNTVLTVVNSPHNPVGAVLERDNCRRLAKTLQAAGIPLVVDEVFHPVYFDQTNQTAAGIDNVIVIGDMSKALSMPGLRAGWIIDADAERRARIIRVRGYLSLSGSPVLEALALLALRNRDKILRRVKTIASANLSELKRFMGLMSDIIDWVSPQAGVLAFPWFRDGRSSRYFCERLIERDVLVAPGDCFGMPDHFRIGFGSQPSGIGSALERMERDLRNS